MPRKGAPSGGLCDSRPQERRWCDSPPQRPGSVDSLPARVDSALPATAGLISNYPKPRIPGSWSSTFLHYLWSRCIVKYIRFVPL